MKGGVLGVACFFLLACLSSICLSQNPKQSLPQEVEKKQTGYSQTKESLESRKQKAKEIAYAWGLVQKIRDYSQWNSRITSSYTLSLWSLKDSSIARILIDTLHQTPPLIQHSILQKLGEFRTVQSLGKIIPIAKNGNPWWVRSTAIAALGQIKHPCAVDTLLECLEEKEPIIQKRSIIALYEITGEGEYIPVSAPKEKVEEVIDFWKKWGEKKHKKYTSISIPSDDLPYTDYISNFQIYKSSDFASFELDVEVYEDKSLCFQFDKEKEDILWMAWAEKDRDAISLESLLPGLEVTLKEKMKDFQRDSWKPFKHKGKNGYRLSYQGIKKEQKYAYSYLVFFVNKNVYQILLRMKPEKSKEANKYLKQILKCYEIME